MSDGAEEQFLVEGIRRYAHALETIQSFQTMLEDRLREVTKAYTCEAFAPKKSAIETGTSDGAFGHVIWALQEGVLRGKKQTVRLELGVWWAESVVAYYCGFIETDANKAIDFTYKGKHSRIEFRKWSRKPRLFMVASADPKITFDDEFKIVLDELTNSFK